MKRAIDMKLIQNLKESSLWNNHLLNDCLSGDVFLAIRDNRICFYYKGGRLFNFDKNGFSTHIKYAAVIDEKKEYLTEKECKNIKMITNFEDGYKRIKENCKRYSHVESEGVAAVYKRHSYIKSNNIIVLDVEISFENEELIESQDRIDFVLYNQNDNSIKFIEAKHYSNPELWSKESPKVIKQIQKYNNQIKRNENIIIEQYTKYIDNINEIFSLKINPPKLLLPEVNLFVFGFDDDQRQGRLDNLIKKNEKYKGIRCYFKGAVNKMDLNPLWKAPIL